MSPKGNKVCGMLDPKDGQRVLTVEGCWDPVSEGCESQENETELKIITGFPRAFHVPVHGLNLQDGVFPKLT